MQLTDITALAEHQTDKMSFEWGELTWFANRPLGNADAVTIGRCVLKPDQGNPRHYHPNCTEYLTVIQGEIEHTGPGGEPIRMKPGDTVTIPPKVWHRAHNVGSGEAVLFIVFDSADRQTVGE